MVALDFAQGGDNLLLVLLRFWLRRVQEVCELLLFVCREVGLAGAEESQVTEFVRSLTVGEVEYVPIARKFPVSCKLPTVILPGIMMSESRGSGAAVSVTATVAVADTTLASGFVHSAVIVVEPGFAPVASPEGLMLAIVGILDVHLI